jgi:nucleoside-diphosphate-sugar epimerase
VNGLYKKIGGKTIGILGLGYIGSNLLNYLMAQADILNLDLIPIYRKNLSIVESRTFDYFIDCAGNSGNFRSDILGTVESNISLLIYLLKNIKIRENYLALSSTRIYGFSENGKTIFSEYCFE